MSFIRTIRRPALVGAAALTAIAVGAAPAMAHHCFVPMYSLDGAPTSENWFVVSAELGAVFEAGYERRAPPPSRRATTPSRPPASRSASRSSRR